ncbi:MAG TPA: metallophosphoesterase [Actinomycetota bacterium]|nr:metallophosphoesterase [Actinomycetota bacterium]
MSEASAAPERTLASFKGTFQTGKSFMVTWGGSTDSGSGVASYSVSVRSAPYNGTFGPWQPFKSSVFAAPVDPVIAAAGDIACGGDHGVSLTQCQEMKTSDLLVQMNPAAVLPLGDTQYDVGAYQYYLTGRGPGTGTGYDPTWGRVKSITRPAVGNHEYGTAQAAGYFDYFNGIGNFSGPAGDRDKGYYSFDVGSWHLIALNSNCAQAGGCGPGLPQEQWLRQDLAANQRGCTLAYMHEPLWSSSSSTTADNPNVRPLVQALYDYGAELLLVGHAHNYERFAQQTPTGQLDGSRGVRQIIVGTGGRSLNPFGTIEPNSEVRDSTTYGVLKVTLRARSYEWQFIPVAGGVFKDSGSNACHGQSPDTVPPTVPILGGTETIGSAEFTGEPGFTYCFRATATDWDGNTSAASAEDCTSIPVDNISFRHWGGWAKKSGAGYYLGSFSQTRNLGATLTLKNVTAKHLAIIVTKCPKCGAIRVFFGGKLVSRIQLRSPTTTKMRIIIVKIFDTPQTGTVKVRVSSRGKLVRVEGLGVSAV